MSIYISGVSFPPKGKRLFVAVNGCGDVYLITYCAEIITKYQPSAKAIELPPHGRLIDADAMLEFVDAVHFRNPLELSWSDADVESMIDSRPTIIPAEEE